MKIASILTDEVILQELGERFAAARVDRNLTQAMLALQAGVSRSTVERIERGEGGAQISSLLRISRVLGLLDRFDTLVAEGIAGPMDQLKFRGKRRQRASRKRGEVTAARAWTWNKPR